MDKTTFNYIAPSTRQMDEMKICRDAATVYCGVLEDHVPDGPDKTYLLRKLREVGMWANVAITRHEDGSPRE